MEYHIEAGAKTRRYIEAVLPSMLAQLGLNRSRKLLMIKVDPELEELGTTVPLAGIDTMLVVLKPNRNWANLGVTLAHELTHVAQFAKGHLKPTPKGRLWRGKFYSNKHPYLEQPWEIQAFAQQELIFRRAIEIG
jgi:hypothetical protein